MQSKSEPISVVRVVLGRRLAVVSGIFLCVVASIMALHVYLLRTVAPLDSPALHALTEQLEREGGNDELRQQLRELDLLARRAFFVRQWQLETGAILLVIGGLVFTVALYLMTAGERRIPDFKQCPGVADPWSESTRARQVIVVVGLLLLVMPLAFVLLNPRDAGLPEAPTGAGSLPPDVEQAVLAVGAVPPPDAARTAFSIDRYWPAFRGPHGLGIAAPDADPPIAWDGETGTGIRWKVDVPRPGTSSPVIWGNRLFLTGADATAREVYCFDADTGALLWRADTAGIEGAPESLPDVLADTGHAAPSVAVDGQRVVAIFSTGVIAGFDFDGRLLWGRDLGTPDNHYGHSASLLIAYGLVYVQLDQHGASEVLALDVETGQTRWRQPRAADTSWASPILIPSCEGMQLVLSSTPMVATYDALTGAPRWSRDVLSGEIGSSPAYAAGRIFAANAHAQAVALDAASGEVLWTSNRFELPDAGSPVATEHHLFLPSSYGAFTCVDAADGSLLWEHDFDEGGYGSPILAGDRIYWITSDGRTRIFKAADTFELIAEPTLGEASQGTPAIIGQRLYIRGAQHLFCIGEAP